MTEYSPDYITEAMAIIDAVSEVMHDRTQLYPADLPTLGRVLNEAQDRLRRFQKGELRYDSD